jgi:hypothetical protein
MGGYIAAISTVVGLAFSLPALAQAPAVTPTCKDGTTFSGATRSGACRGHRGVQGWEDASSPAAPSTAPAASPTPSNNSTPAQTTRGVPGNGPVWVNTTPRSTLFWRPHYEHTNPGTYMTEAAAKAEEQFSPGPRKSGTRCRALSSNSSSDRLAAWPLVDKP